MKTKQLLLSCLLLASTTSLWAAFPTSALSGGGTGTVSDPYKIATPADLIEVRDAVNSSTSEVAASYYELTANIDMSGTEWTTPIGTLTKNFSGKFNGRGYSITNLFCGTSTTANTTANINMGLFGIINGASIKNVNVNVSFYIARTVASHLGGLVSQISGGTNTIDNCRVSGTISVTGDFSVLTVAGQQRVGGVIAYVVTASSELYVTNCFSNVDITNVISNTGTVTTNLCHAAQILADAGAVTKVGIVNCLAGGSITMRDNSGAACAGGILGVRNGIAAAIQTEIINCCAYTNINANMFFNNNAGIGGIAGSQNQTSNLYNVKNCIALNPALNYISQAATVPTPRRVGVKNTTTSGAGFSENYALTTMNMKAWTTTTTAFTIPAFTNDATLADGANLVGADSIAQIADGLSKLNAYVGTNPSYAGIATTTFSSASLNTWSAGTIYPKLAMVPTLSFGVSSLNVLPTASAFTQAATSISSGAITYNSSNTSIATVSAAGLVTLTGTEGSTTISATVASVAGMYTSATASYLLNVSTSTAIEKNNSANIIVRTAGKKVVVSGAAGKTIVIFDVAGRKVNTTFAKENSTEISLNATGILFVRIDNKTSKVIL